MSAPHVSRSGGVFLLHTEQSLSPTEDMYHTAPTMPTKYIDDGVTDHSGHSSKACWGPETGKGYLRAC
jgi:hypothetical protein